MSVRIGSAVLSFLVFACAACAASVRPNADLDLASRPPRAFTLPVRGEKTDIVVMRNGDRITCEIKSLDRGRLTVSTDSMATVNIEWEDIARIESKQVFRFEMIDGAQHYGSLVRATEPRTIRLSHEGETRSFPMADVIRIDPLKDTLRGRLDGHIKLGFGFTKASEVSQTSFGGGLVYRGPSERIRLDVSTIVTTQESKNTRNADGTLDYRRYLGHRWFGFASGGLERKDELGIDLRSSVGAGFGHALVQSNTALWAVGAGVTVNHESAPGADDENNVESLLGTELSIFDYDEPATDLSASLIYYENLDGLGRSRVDLDIRLRKEIISDFFFDLTFYASYDSRPPSATASKSDFGIVTGVGYSF